MLRCTLQLNCLPRREHTKNLVAINRYQLSEQQQEKLHKPHRVSFGRRLSPKYIAMPQIMTQFSSGALNTVNYLIKAHKYNKKSVVEF